MALAAALAARGIHLPGRGPNKKDDCAAAANGGNATTAADAACPIVEEECEFGKNRYDLCDTAEIQAAGTSLPAVTSGRTISVYGFALRAPLRPNGGARSVVRPQEPSDAQARLWACSKHSSFWTLLDWVR